MCKTIKDCPEQPLKRSIMATVDLKPWQYSTNKSRDSYLNGTSTWHKASMNDRSTQHKRSYRNLKYSCIHSIVSTSLRQQTKGWPHSIPTPFCKNCKEWLFSSRRYPSDER